MSTFATIMLVLLLADSLYVLVMAYKQEWKKVAIGVAIGVLLDWIILHYGQ